MRSSNNRRPQGQTGQDVACHQAISISGRDEVHAARPGEEKGGVFGERRSPPLPLSCRRFGTQRLESGREIGEIGHKGSIDTEFLVAELFHVEQSVGVVW